MAETKGEVLIDAGAEQALLNNKSLLAVGIIKVSGVVKKGDTVVIKNSSGQRIGVGISTGAFFSRLSLGKLIPGAQKRSKQSRQEKRVKDADEKRSLPRRTLSVLLKIGFYSAVLGSLVGIGLLGYVIEVAEELPDVNALKNPNFELPSIIYDRNGKQVYELYVEKRILIKKEDIPQDVKNALIATEDSRFL
ncbi:hypothetical protein CHS0354_035334 [Potamilus streckersoni]|uniref:PUA domain-containing protein n=1 Tax=Potamilus streckersoni TaxID=2493646 RepID=A0AAE0S305_9BIVA|nr:hypothetical protein CHS0354_035334 [Potamilus streckersoni]